MYLGQCVELAPTEELFTNPLHPYTKALLAAIPFISLDEGDAFTNLIRGEVTSPVNPKPGCRFIARCEIADEGCAKQNIPLSSRTEGHYVACIRYREGL